MLLVASAVAEDRSMKPRWQSRFATYSIASVARRDGRSDWNEVTQGNRIVLPARVRDVLESRGLSPMQFQILNPNNKDVRLYTGPLDFCAADGECYLPSWVMKQLGIKEGEPCAVATACFPKGTFAKFQPHKSEFLDIPDHGLMLTTTLENMAALTQGSTVRVTDGRRTYNLDVLEVKGKAMPPGVRDDSDGRAVDLVLAELVTDFEAAKDTLRKKKGGKAPAKAAAAAAADADADADDEEDDEEDDEDDDVPVAKFKSAPKTGFAAKARTLSDADDDDGDGGGSSRQSAALAAARGASASDDDAVAEAAGPPACWSASSRGSGCCERSPPSWRACWYRIIGRMTNNVSSKFRQDSSGARRPAGAPSTGCRRRRRAAAPACRPSTGTSTRGWRRACSSSSHPPRPSARP